MPEPPPPRAGEPTMNLDDLIASITVTVTATGEEYPLAEKIKAGRKIQDDLLALADIFEPRKVARPMRASSARESSQRPYAKARPDRAGLPPGEFPSERGICDVCETAPIVTDDIMCAECRARFEASCDTVNDPVEIELNKHQHLCGLSNMDQTMCMCGLLLEGGPAFYRRHVAEKVYESLGLDGPMPWTLGPESPTRQREGF